MNTMQTIEGVIHNTKAKAHRNNARFWLEGNKANDYGFGPGVTYYVYKFPGDNPVIIYRKTLAPSL